MKITTRLTYVLPLLVLLGTTIWLTVDYALEFFHYYNEPGIPQITIAIALTALIFITAKNLAKKYTHDQLRIGFFLFPLALHVVLSLVIRRHLSLEPLVFLFCALYYWSYILFSRRYTAILTDTTIEYQTLLGQSGIIPLTGIIKLEEKKSILPYLIRYLRFMNLAKKTSITFCDENRDEYEIDIFINLFDSKKVFEKIIQKANDNGNGGIRQYAF